MRFALFTLCLHAFALDLPLAISSAPDGKLIVLNSGAKPSLSVIGGTETAVPDAFLGLAQKGNTIYVGGGSTGSVHEFAYENGAAKFVRSMKAGDFIGDVALSPDGRLLYAADLFANLVSVINPQSGRVIDRFKSGRRPYRIVFHPDGKSYFVSSWADASVYQYSTSNGEEIGRLRLGPHTTDMVLSAYKPPVEEGRPTPDWKYRLFVTAANTNNVYAVAISESKSMRMLEAIHIAPTPLTPLGMTPSALTLAPDQKHLYVACSDADAIALIDVSGERSVVEGYLAPGVIYPTALHFTASGKLYAAGARSDAAAEVTSLAPEPWPEERVSPAAPSAQSTAKPERVIYILTNARPDALMAAVAGTAPDFTVKTSRSKLFHVADPANTPFAGYLWTNAVAAGHAIRNYGVFVSQGKTLDPALGAHTNLNYKGPADFLDEWKQLETANRLPKLALVQVENADQVNAIIVGVKQSRNAATTAIYVGGEGLRSVEAALILRPMTRQDAAQPILPSR